MRYSLTRSCREGANRAFLLLSLLIAFAMQGTPAQAVEEARFTVDVRDGAFEIRDYPAAIAAELTVTGDQDGAANTGFRILAGYIFGGNRGHRSIPMTAPVAQQRVGDRIPMTAPVTQTPAAGAWIIRFTMPAAYSLQTLPTPNDPRVKLAAVAPARFAVIRFSGLATRASVATRTADLIAFIRRRGLHPAGAATLAQYDPPWTLWFLRRNEVMIRLKA